MRLFSETYLLKMEATWTRHRKEIEDAPTFWQTCQYPTLLLKPDEAYTRKSYLRVVSLSAVAVTLLICAIQCFILAVAALIVPQLWSVILDPKNHAQQIGILSEEGFYYLPFLPFILLLFSLAINWPTYFFWNRRAKRLQREGPVSVPIVAAALVPDDPNVWPPPPRL